jgi:V-type H+-transporting ATPase subunit H
MSQFPTDPVQQRIAWEGGGAQFAELFIKLVKKIYQQEYLQYVLALIDMTLTADETRTAVFIDMYNQDEVYPFEPLMNLLRHDGGDWFINSRVSKILALFLVMAPKYGVPGDKVAMYTRSLINWLVSHAKEIDSDPKKAAPVLTTLRTILRSQDARIIFHEFDGINILGNLLKSPHHLVIYNSMFCLWLLSYNETLAKNSFTETNVVKRIVETVKNVHRERISRVAIATLCNLAQASHTSCLHIVEGGFMKVLPNLLLRKWGDEELEANLQSLDEILQRVMSELGSWDMYKAEVLSGNLEWGMVHKEDRFWRENASRFSENNFQIAGVLIDLISNSPNTQVVAVALNDIGRFVRFHPAGRGVIQSIPEAKLTIMEKLNHPDPEIQKEALLAIQKLMVSNWEFLPQQ